MNISDLSIQNFRCFDSLKVSFDPNLSVIVGVNGAGKTAVLEAIVIAIGTFLLAFEEKNNTNIKKTDAFQKFFSIGEEIDVQSQFPVTLSATGTLDNLSFLWSRSLRSPSGGTKLTAGKEFTSLSQEKQNRMMNGDQSLLLPLICYYGTARLWDYHRAKNKDSKQNNRANAYSGCLDGTANVKQMLNWFEKKTLNEASSKNQSLTFLAVRTAIEQCFTLMTGFNDVSVLYNYDTKEIDLLYSDENKARVRKSVQYFSDGYKGTISLIADIAYRMAQLNPMLGESVLTETEGIVLIDEIDLHLHPAWQQRILGDLTKIFPKIQFIVSTHAPSVINSVESKSLIILDKNNIRTNYMSHFRERVAG